jgi:hypothetical protein
VEISSPSTPTFQQEGVLLPAVERAPLHGPLASSPVFALIEGSLLSPMPGLLPFPKPAVELGVVLMPKFGTVKLWVNDPLYTLLVLLDV